MSFWKNLKKAAKFSNPVTAAMEVSKMALGKNDPFAKVAPKLKVAGMDIDLVAATRLDSNTLLEGVESAGEQDSFRREQMAETKNDKLLNQDQKEFNKFAGSDLLDNPDAGLDLFNPNIKRSGKLKSQAEGLMTYFNNRKSQIMSRATTPGINQTRFG